MDGLVATFRDRICGKLANMAPPTAAGLPIRFLTTWAGFLVAASLGLTDYSKVDMLNLRYKSDHFGAERSLGLFDAGPDER